MPGIVGNGMGVWRAIAGASCFKFLLRNEGTGTVVSLDAETA